MRMASWQPTVARTGGASIPMSQLVGGVGAGAMGAGRRTARERQRSRLPRGIPRASLYAGTSSSTHLAPPSAPAGLAEVLRYHESQPLVQTIWRQLSRQLDSCADCCNAHHAAQARAVGFG